MQLFTVVRADLLLPRSLHEKMYQTRITSRYLIT